jgi:hypothetical protein
MKPFDARSSNQLRIGALGAVAVCGALLGIALPASADGQPSDQADIVQAARNLGTSPNEVADFTVGQGEFAQLANLVQEKLPRHFVSAVWDGPDSPGTVIYVRAGGLDDATALAPSTRILVVDALSAADREGAEQDLLRQAVAATGGRWHVGVDVDPLTNAAEVTIESGDQVDFTLTRPAGVVGITIRWAGGGSHLE